MFESIKSYQGKLRKRGQQGFTLMELLIVIAIIVVLVAIAIPVFTAQLDRAKDAADQANGRALYAIAMADYMDDGQMQYNYDTTSDAPNVEVSGEDLPSQKLAFSDRTSQVYVNMSEDTSVPPTVTVDSKGNDGQGWIFGGTSL